jgi:DNA-binding CsgD family transcriptional regulator
MPHHYKIRHAGITSRQIEVLRWLANGKYPRDIAVILGITRRTVDFHLYRAVERLDCITSVQAVAKAVRNRII